MKQIRLITLFLLIVVLDSCTKEKIMYLSSASETSKELEEVIQEKSLKRVYAVNADEPFPSSFPSQGGTSWKFSNGFITLQYGFGQSYNLTYLRKYLVTQVVLSDQTSAQALILYF